jgi:NAD(P)-dependent dehydrogenase (short-subunit alcohol dehydrogenase family)
MGRYHHPRRSTTGPAVSGKVALVVGAGGELGSATCEEFAGAGYAVVGLRRVNTRRTSTTARIIACDLADPRATGLAVAEVVSEHARVDVLVCNAAHLVMAPFAQLTLDDFDTSWRVCVGSALAAAHSALPSMAARGSGAIIVVGATASLRGTAGYSAFAAAKFALRGLAQSLAREYQPLGVHVAHVVLDGVLRGSPSAARFGKSADNLLEPTDAAAMFRQIAEQRPSAWTHEADLRPHTERF